MNETSTNYYEILDVDKKASQDDIKKKFRKLSMKYHPDRNGNSKESENIFKQISESYDTLGDINKRREYDASMNVSIGGNDLFNLFFNSASAKKSPNMHNVSKIPFPPSLFGMFNPGSSTHMEIPISMSPFDDFFAGQIEQELKNMFISGSVNNGYRRNNNQVHNDVPLHQSNKETSELKPAHININVSIDLIQAYTGCSIPIEINREIWHDQSIRDKENETIYITIPPGIDNNEVILLKEKGSINKYNQTGDVKIHVKIENTSEFIRNGIDLILHKDITLKESLCGFVFEFNHITGKSFRIHNKIGTIISPEFKKKIEKLGMKRDDHTGNLIIIFHVKYPETIELDTLHEIEKLLG